MNRHAVLTHAPIPYFSNAAAGSESEKHLQGIVRAIKNGQNLTLTKTGQQVLATKLLVDGFTMADADRLFFGADRTMVPVPSSTVLGPRLRETWPCYDVGCRLVEKGVARDARPILTRKVAIPQSHRVSKEQRPTVEQVVASLAVDADLLAGTTAVTLIDDVVSTGTNGMGAMVALKRAGFAGDIVLFSVGHTANSGTTGPFYGEVVWLEGRHERAFRPAPEPGWLENVLRWR